MNIYPTGTKVKLCGEDAVVIAAMIQDENVTYKLAYMNGTGVMQDWFHPCLISGDEKEQIRIGFKTEEK